ncbi:MAG: SdrD B-like domain-containing protein [Thermoguttaceae bacterium]
MDLLKLFFHRGHSVAKPHHRSRRHAGSRVRTCRFEQVEARQMLSATVAPLHVATTYFEDSNNFDEPNTLKGTGAPVADLFQVSFTGGAAGTELTQIRIDTDNTFFNTAAGGGGAYGDFPLTIVNHDGFQITGTSVANGGTQLVISLSGFTAGDKLVFSIDVDENGNLEANAVAEGAEFEGATLTASFVAPHMQNLTTSALVFYDRYDLSGTGLDGALPNDDYDNAAALAYVPTVCSPGPVYTAGASGSAQQMPLPITLSGAVFEDMNADNKQESGDAGIAGVQLVLYEFEGDYITTGRTATTDANGNYKFEGLLPGMYQIVEVQPDGYLSVGDTPGTVGGQTRGVVATVDILSSINLDGGEDSVHNDFAETRPASVSGYVYHDENNNGVFDDGETPLGGVTVALLDSSGNATGQTTTTDDWGYYSFDSLMPGRYGVAETQPDGYTDGLDVAGTAGGTAHNPGDLIDGIQLVSGQQGKEYDFGELLPVSVSGFVYVDANNNGVFDDGETPIGGVTLTLLDSSGTSTGLTTITDAAGFYLFDDLTPGTYGVAETQPTGYKDGLDAAGTAGGTAHNPGDLIDGIALASGQRGKEYDFGELLPAAIAGKVYVDVNANNAFDTGETLLSGVTVYLLDSSGNRLRSTVTDANGKYAFTDLTPGIYGVEEVQPASYLEGGDQVGTAGGTLDGYDKILSAHLDAGVSGQNYDFYEIIPAKISGYVFQDGQAIKLKQSDPDPDIPTLRDGKLTSDDTMLSGIVLELCDATGYPLTDANGQKITTTTDANGYYQFTGLRPGVYSIIEIQPTNYVPGVDSVGSNGGMLVNRYSAPDESILSTLAVSTSGAAIVQIPINPGDVAVQYNFSEVLVERTPDSPPGGPTPTPSPSPTPTPAPIPYSAEAPIARPYYSSPLTVTQPVLGGGGLPGGYTWHLSVIDAGQPRSDASAAEFTESDTGLYFDPVSWSGPAMDQCQFVLADANGVPIKTLRFGMSGAKPVAGDWDGSGVTKIGVFLDGLWFLDLNGNGVWDDKDLWIKLGKKGDQPVAGDWNGDDKTDIGIFGPAWIGDLQAVMAEPGLPDAQNPPPYKRPKNVPPDPTDAAIGWRTMKKGTAGRMRSDLIDHVFEYGRKGDIAVAGDWNGDGIYSIGVFRGGTWYLDMDGDGRFTDRDTVVEYGQPGDLPVVGDWTGDGISKVGVYRHGTFYLDTNNNHRVDAADKVFELGGPNDKPVAGDWTGDGVDKVGVYQDNVPAETPLQASRQ